MGETYLKKPPLYNWLIALAAGKQSVPPSGDSIRSVLARVPACCLP